jgi:dienelactone hydrolase
MRILLMGDAHQPMAAADVPLSGLCRVQSGVKFRPSDFGALRSFMPTRDLDYRCDDVNLRGYLAWNDNAGARPGVLVFHEGIGLGEFAMERARRLADLGYVALAADMFGDRRQATNLQEVATIVGGLRAEPEKLRARGRAALATLAAQPGVDATRLAAIGFCFGGSVVLELAREGADLKAVVSFHGVLGTKMPAQSGLVKASVLVLTGAEDPLAPPDQVTAFENEMRDGAVRDWQVVSYGNTLHGFTNPAADGSMMRTALYNEQADRRSWAAMRSLFDEVLT